MSRIIGSSLKGQALGTKVKTGGRMKRVTRILRSFLYAFVFVVVIALAKTGSVDSTNNSTMASMAEQVTQVGALPSVEQMTEASVAANMAETMSLPIAPNSANMSTSLAIKHEIAQLSDTTIQKPLIIDVGGLSRGITVYKTVEGDTLAKIAEKNNVSTRTLRWANKLKRDGDMRIGVDLVIPPVDGVVYKVKKGDKIESLARKYQSTTDKITVFNDLELEGLTVGQTIIIPEGILPDIERPEYVPPSQQPVWTGTSTGYAAGSNVKIAAGNKYAYGYCTWYVYNMRQAVGKPIGSFWGDAYMWLNSAQRAGFATGREPRVHAIMHNYGGWGGLGHVAFVEKVEGDKVTVSEMNNSQYGGWNIKSYRTLDMKTAKTYNYIYW